MGTTGPGIRFDELRFKKKYRYFKGFDAYHRRYGQNKVSVK
jgi:hypothetical protein